MNARVLLTVIVLTGLSFGGAQPDLLALDCASVLVIIDQPTLGAYGEDLLIARLQEGGANLTHAEEAAEITQKYIVQIHDVLTNTRSGKMTFKSSLREGTYSQKELAATYGSLIANTEQLQANQGQATYTSRELSAREYASFQRQTGLFTFTYEEEAHYSDWFNQFVRDSERQEFWQTVKRYNSDILILGTAKVYPLGDFGGLHASRAVVSLRVLDVREDRPKVLKAFATVANGVDLSQESAGYKAFNAAMEQVAELLQGVIPCYKYQKPVKLYTPLGALGIAVLDLKGDRQYGSKVAKIAEAKLSKFSEFKVYTRTDLEMVLSEQRLGLSGLIENPAEVGKLAGVRYLLTGMITELTIEDQEHYLRVPILSFLKLTIRNIRAGISLALLDTVTGQVVWATERSGNMTGFSILGLEFNMSPLQAFRKLVENSIAEMYENLIKDGH